MARIEKGYARIGEGQLHLRMRRGESEQTPIVLLHASPASSASLAGLMEAWRGDETLYAFDTPCNGQSCPPAAEAPEIADFADMLDRGCDDLDLGEIALYGTHTGAHIAIAWALARPDRVRALVLDGVALLSDAERADMLANYAAPRRPDEIGSQFHWAWQYIRDQMIFFPHYRKDAAHMRAGGSFDPELLHQFTLDILSNLDSYHLPYHAVFRHEVRADLARLDLPTLLIGEECGPMAEGYAELCQLVPDARRASPGHGPAAKAQAIAQFLQGVSR